MPSYNLYVEKNSFLHRLNPMLKLLLTFILIIFIFCANTYSSQFFVVALIFLMCLLSKISFRTFFSILATCFFMFIILFLINWLCYKQPVFSNISIFENDILFGNFKSLLEKHKSEIRNYDKTCFFISDLWGGDVIKNIQLTKPTTDDLKYISCSLPNKMEVYIWYTSYWYTLSPNVIFKSLIISTKIFLMITTVTIFISTTNNSMIIIALEDILYPLKYLKVPVNEISMILSIAIRFVPSLIQESNMILRAQASRGVDFRNGNVKDKFKSLICLIIPMFSLAFYKADDLSNTMETRGYKPHSERTYYQQTKVSHKDITFSFLFSILLGLIIVFIISKKIFYGFTPIEFLIIN